MQIFLDEAKIQKMVKQIAVEISNDYAGKSVILIAPLKGAVPFVADLCRHLTVPNSVEFVYLKSLNKGGTIYFEKDISTNLRGENVIIVEEIIDAGRKLNFLQNRVLLTQPASLKIAALIDKPSRRELPVQPDYVGQVVDDRFIVGYGMDSDEIGRNYRDIYMLKN